MENLLESAERVECALLELCLKSTEHNAFRFSTHSLLHELCNFLLPFSVHM